LGNAGARGVIAMQSTQNLEFGLREADNCVVTYDATDGSAADQK